MRAWIAECDWGDLEPEDVGGLTDVEVVRGVRTHYDGGVEAFLQDQDVPEPAERVFTITWIRDERAETRVFKTREQLLEWGGSQVWARTSSIVLTQACDHAQAEPELGFRLEHPDLIPTWVAYRTIEGG